MNEIHALYKDVFAAGVDVDLPGIEFRDIFEEFFTDIQVMIEVMPIGIELIFDSFAKLNCKFRMAANALFNIFDGI